jgi:hypothetical protein
LQRPIHDRFLRRELADESVQAFGGLRDVVDLFVEMLRERVQLPYKASEVLFASGESGAERASDVLHLSEAAAVEQDRESGQRLFGAGVTRPRG